jgi:hypothetical protein
LTVCAETAPDCFLMSFMLDTSAGSRAVVVTNVLGLLVTPLLALVHRLIVHRGYSSHGLTCYRDGSRAAPGRGKAHQKSTSVIPSRLRLIWHVAHLSPPRYAGLLMQAG